MSSQPQLQHEGLTLETIIALLRAEQRLAQWQVTEVVTERTERYLTFLTTESERQALATSWKVWTALPERPGAPGSGSAQGSQGEGSFTLGAGDSPQTLRQCLSAAIEGAATTANPSFTLPGARSAGVSAPPADPAALADRHILADPQRAMDALVEAYAQAAAAAPWARPSTLELFLTSERRRLVNHTGLDLTACRTSAYAEYVLLHRPATGDEVEYFDRTQTSALEHLRLSDRVARSAHHVRDGARARATPTGEVAVVISEDSLAELMEYYVYHADAGVHARRIHAFARGAAVVDRTTGDPLHLTSDPTVLSQGAYLWDEHGYAPVVQPLIAEDRLVGLCGEARWMRALDLPPRGTCGTLVVPPGTTPAHELSRGALEVVQFSDFRPRFDTGAFSGEIRLAYWHGADGERIPVKGGSVSGTLADAMARAQFSCEVVTTGRYRGPRALRIDRLTVAG